MDYKDKYKHALDLAKQVYDTTISKQQKENIEIIFPELRESEDERIRKAIIEFFELQDDNTTYSLIPKKDILAWLEKQVPIDEEKVLIGARKDIALSIMNFLDRNTLGMDLSSIECADLESAVVDSDWSKVYDYMKKKLEKQGEQKPAWSEEDEKRVNHILNFIWKNRKGDTDEIYQQEQNVNWLKSLKQRHTWKPSEKQIEALEDEVRNNKTVFRKKVLNELLEQLKKL